MEGGRRFEIDNGLGSSFGFRDVPFEFVGKVASASAMAKASDIECRSSTARHISYVFPMILSKKYESQQLYSRCQFANVFGTMAIDCLRELVERKVRL